MWLKWHKLETREEESSRSQVRCIERISLLQPILGTRRIRVPRLREESEKESRDVTACGLRIQKRHCLWVTNTETSLPVGYEYMPVGYEYRNVSACGLQIQKRHCLWVTNTETSLPLGYEYRDVTVRFAHTDVTVLTLFFETDEKDALLENEQREIIALLSSECWMWWLLPLGSYYSLQRAECLATLQHCVLIIRWKTGKFVFNRHFTARKSLNTFVNKTEIELILEIYIFLKIKV